MDCRPAAGISNRRGGAFAGGTVNNFYISIPASDIKEFNDMLHRRAGAFRRAWIRRKEECNADCHLSVSAISNQLRAYTVTSGGLTDGETGYICASDNKLTIAMTRLLSLHLPLLCR